MRRAFRPNRGFTLTELVIVIIVLGILAATAVPKFLNLQRDAKISTLAGLSGQLQEQSTIAHLRAKMDNIPVADDCSYDCNGHPNWDGSMEAGHYFVNTTDGTRLYIRWGYPLYTSSTGSVAGPNFKKAMGVNDSEFVFAGENPLKIVPRQWQDKLDQITAGSYKCHVEYWSATSPVGNSIKTATDDC